MSSPAEVSKVTADVAAGVVALSALLQWLPAFAALLSIIWTGLRIYDWVKDKWASRKV